MRGVIQRAKRLLMTSMTTFKAEKRCLVAGVLSLMASKCYDSSWLSIARVGRRWQSSCMTRPLHFCTSAHSTPDKLEPCETCECCLVAKGKRPRRHMGLVRRLEPSSYESLIIGPMAPSALQVLYKKGFVPISFRLIYKQYITIFSQHSLTSPVNQPKHFPNPYSMVSPSFKITFLGAAAIALLALSHVKAASDVPTLEEIEALG